MSVPAPLLLMPLPATVLIDPKSTTLPAPKSRVFTWPPAPPKFRVCEVESVKRMFTPVPVVMVPRFAEPESTSFAKVYVPAVVKLVLEPDV